MVANFQLTAAFEAQQERASLWTAVENLPYLEGSCLNLALDYFKIALKSAP
jgi:hypothetical protein